MNTDCPVCGDRGWGGMPCNDCAEPEVAQIAALIYEHRWYGVPGQDRGRCSCHWEDPDAPGEITYTEHTRHVAYAIVHTDTGTGEGER